jgi:NAD(P)-dependent dehydrogenase (short-subunit alcohol dehydrogenase family)
MLIPMGSAYPVAKSALKAMSQHLRLEMAPFGVQVTVLEPGGVATAMVEFGADAGEQQWRTIPEPLRSQYRQYFSDGATALDGKFRFYQSDEFADRVYRRVILAQRLKPVYLIGSGVWPLPWLHRLLPVSLVMSIWARMFAVQKS